MNLPTPKAALKLGWSADFLRARSTGDDALLLEGVHWKWRSSGKNAPRVYDIAACAEALQSAGYSVSDEL